MFTLEEWYLLENTLQKRINRLNNFKRSKMVLFKEEEEELQYLKPLLEKVRKQLSKEEG